jgi:energy-coupling factor transport system ATP-binding protein
VITTAAPPAVRARALGFTYRDAPRPALRGVDFDLAAQAWGLLLGPTGAGKSTLVRALNRTVPRFFPGRLDGTLEVAGRDTGSMTVPAMARLAGVVFQDFETQILSTSCLLDVAFAMESRCLPAADIRRRALELLARVGLPVHAGRDPATLSGGEKQRLVIASVLALEAPLLVLDEPASDLDPSGREAIYALVESLRPGAVLLVEHDLEGVPPTDAGVLLEQGQVIGRWEGESALRARAPELEAAGVRAPPLATLAASLRTRWKDRVPGRLPMTPEGFGAALRQDGWTVTAAGWTGRARRGAEGPELMRCERVTHTYGRGASAVRALDEVSLPVHAGERVVIIGANGSGKTTLARHMAGLDRPDSGRVLWQGRDVRTLEPRERARCIGFVFQNPDHQIFASTVREEVAFGPVQLGFDGGGLRERCERALRTVGLDGREEADPFALTKGERQCWRASRRC